MAGAAPAPVDAEDAAVVMIDCQREYLDGHLPLAGVEAALTEGAKLVAAARARGIPVFHVQHRGKPGGLFDPEGPSFAIYESLAPEAGETVVEKGLPNAFAATGLDDALVAAGPSISWSPVS